MEQHLLNDWSHPPTHPTAPGATRVQTFQLPTNYRSGSAIVHAGAASLGGGATANAKSNAGHHESNSNAESAITDVRSSLRVVPAPNAPQGETVLHYARDDFEEARAVRCSRNGIRTETLARECAVRSAAGAV